MEGKSFHNEKDWGELTEDGNILSLVLSKGKRKKKRKEKEKDV